ncbi:glycoside hydrolase family 55 protein [Wolfiporia cocos MD-104 SS10]|uniref:Glycoside hydrolase family 55 protein n=1 Tax=Wolfiporia cocos (strain MD-104) TaxID=742152 RepID=A0A2H3JK78_WOLCO|nr:glycoside hydrolase family 55 protein [Wolfiporia cocos MD-104 SS10]
MLASVLLLGYGLLAAAPLAAALGTACSSAIASGTAAPSDPFWMQNIKHQGTSAFNPDPSSYTVFRNVMDYGATGDGTTDDTDAINSAISSGGRCGGGTCASSTVTPAVVYFPQGTYLVSAPLVQYYYTQFIGDARVPPTIVASSSFSGIAVIDVDPYIPGGGGAQWYNDTNNFFRSVRNFVIDLTNMPATSTATGIHWQVAQATTLYNIVVEMSTASDTAHQGIWMENGSGGFMGDLVLNGGKYGMWVGNQQFTVRNVTVNNAQSAIYVDWNWGWTFQDITINNCEVGFDLATGGTTESSQTAGGQAIIDAVVSDTSVFVRTSEASTSLAGSIVLNNCVLNNVDTAVGVVGGAVVLAGGTLTIDSWGQGNVFSGTSNSYTFTQGNIPAPTKAGSLLDSTGRIFGRGHPQYVDYAVDQFVSVKTLGAAGDGTTDDTATLQSILNEYSGCNIIFFDAGTYLITSTLTIPAGTQMVGEAWSVIMGSGSAFADQSNPTVMVQVGESGSSGILEITDILFVTQGPTPGAIVVEWNVNSDTQGGAGMWDSHIRYTPDGTNLQTSQCPAGSDSNSCFAAFLALHLTSGSNAYLEGTWVWLADHDLDSSAQGQLTLFSGRGILSESAGPVWLIGTSEHHTLYQYNIAGASDHYMGLIQTETPYYQPSPSTPTPFSIENSYNDPSFPSSQSAAWALYVQSATDIIVFGAGHYSFYQNYVQTCLSTASCQDQIVSTDSSSSLYVYSLATVGASYQLSVGGSGVISQSDNPDGLQSTVTVWTQ